MRYTLSLYRKTSEAEIKQTFSQVPPNTTYLHLNDIECDASLSTIFAAIPDSVTTLELFNIAFSNPFKDKSDKDLASALATIPKNVTTLNFNFTDFRKKVTPFYYDKSSESSERLRTALASIPKTVSSLGLAATHLAGYTGLALAQAFKEIPQLRELDISCQTFGRAPSAELAQAFAALPSDLYHLNLGNCELSNPQADLAIVFSSLPNKLATLDLCGNDLGNLTPEKLQNAFAALPRHLAALRLSTNWLSRLPGTALAQAFSALPTNLEYLDLQSALQHDTTLKTVFSSLPPCITHLDLSYTGSRRTLSNTEFADALTALPEKLTHLNLTSNRLNKFNPDELAQVLSALPKNLGSLYLGQNNLGQNNLGQNNFGIHDIATQRCVVGMQKLFNALPKKLTSLHLDGEDFWLYTQSEISMILTSLPANTTLSVHFDEYANQHNETYCAKRNDLKQCFAAIPAVEVIPHKEHAGSTCHRLSWLAYNSDPATIARKNKPLSITHSPNPARLFTVAKSSDTLPCSQEKELTKTAKIK